MAITLCAPVCHPSWSKQAAIGFHANRVACVSAFINLSRVCVCVPCVCVGGCGWWGCISSLGVLVKQAAINAEKERLASVRVREDSALAQEAALISGQQAPGIASLEELLRRPHVHYR